jgi:tRNA A37 N6-isopentenylltransferase MiaA
MKIKSEEELIMKKLNKENIGEIVARGLIFVVGGTIALIASFADSMSTDGSTSASTGYDGAVDAIVNSNMWSADRKEAIAAMDRHANIEMYNAVIRVAQNDQMWSADKLNTIKCIFGK